MTTTIERASIDPQAIPLEEAGSRILGHDGPFAASLPGYEPRQAQIDLANLIGRTLDEQGKALVEAGTGTGKSFGYLVPSILKVLKAGGKVAVSTDTIALQEQLVKKDLPFLERALGVPIHYAIAKGRGNFFCRRNADGFLREFGPALPLIQASVETALKARADGWDGDKATVPFPLVEQHWPEMAADDTCEGKGCPHAAGCPYLRAKSDTENADVIVTNATMYLLHHYVRSRTGDKGILPEHTVWIADEAHTLADKAQDVFGTELSQLRAPNVVKRVERQAASLDVDLGGIDLKKIEQANLAFFRWFHGATKKEQLLEDFPETVRQQAAAAGERLVELLKPITVEIDRAASRLSMAEQERHWALDGLAGSIKSLIDDIRAVFRDPKKWCPRCAGSGEAGAPVSRPIYDGDDWADEVAMAETLPEGKNPCLDCQGSGKVLDDNVVRYVELSEFRNGEKAAKVHIKPAETGGIFRGLILPELESAVFCSATLATGKGPAGFVAIADELGVSLNEAVTMQVPSPFDYPAQVRGYIPRRCPETKSATYHTDLATELASVLTHTRGRAFVLFTSKRDLEAVRDLLTRIVRFPVLCQGDDTKDNLVRRFKAEEGSVLLGLKTFWTGVDIPGDDLSCVIIPKLPFPAPSPLVDARCRKIEERGGNGFRDYSLPRCIRDFLQGFGRLIRRMDDTGLFVVLDSRLTTSSYGGKILHALPAFRWSNEL